VTAAVLIAPLPAGACPVITLAAFTAADAWCELRDTVVLEDRRRAARKIVAPTLIGLVAVAAAM
jgi:hypothetical protein